VQRLMTEEAIGRPLSATVLRGDQQLELELRPVELGA
jgi:hypothetical protein